MTKSVPNTIGLRSQLESKGIALNSSGSYVLSSFDADELKQVQGTNFAHLKFSGEDYVVVARGTKGSLAKLAKVTVDRKFARYFGDKCISVQLINGEVFTKAEFMRGIAQNDTLHVVHVSTARDFVGILHGNAAAKYKSLVYPVLKDFCILDLEVDPPPQSLNMKVRIVATNPPAGAKISDAAALPGILDHHSGAGKCLE